MPMSDQSRQSGWYMAWSCVDNTHLSCLILFEPVIFCFSFLKLICSFHMTLPQLTHWTVILCKWLVSQTWINLMFVWCYHNEGMNAAVRAVVRMGLFLGCKVYLIKEVYKSFLLLSRIIMTMIIITTTIIIHTHTHWPILLQVRPVSKSIEAPIFGPWRTT